MKVIFLDIDGVLNNSKHCEMLVNLLGKEQYFDLLKNLQEQPFDYRSVQLLQKLIFETNAEVVLSSTWRLDNKHTDLIEAITGIKIYGKTPRILGGCRGDEIEAYLKKCEDINDYVIIDDDSDMLGLQMTNFVKCDGRKGFTKKEYEKCIKILNGFRGEYI